VVEEPEGKKLEKFGLNGLAILERVLGKRREVVEWVHLAQDKDQWRALGNTVMNLGFHKRQEIS
jgi:hypothetical protein